MGIIVNPNKANDLFDNVIFLSGEGLLSSVVVNLSEAYARIKMDIGIKGACGGIFLIFNDDVNSANYLNAGFVSLSSSVSFSGGSAGIYLYSNITDASGKLCAIDGDLKSGNRRQLRTTSSFSGSTNQLGIFTGTGLWKNTADQVTKIGFTTVSAVPVKYSIFLRGIPA